MENKQLEFYLRRNIETLEGLSENPIVGETDERKTELLLAMLHYTTQVLGNINDMIYETNLIKNF